jgi:hypothetical protein
MYPLIPGDAMAGALEMVYVCVTLLGALVSYLLTLR